MERTKITSFEDLHIYQVAREFRKEVLKLISKLPKEEKYILVSQMKRAALSITNNIAEGYGRYHCQENIQFCRQARGSVYELIDDLNHCLDEGYIQLDRYNNYKSRAYDLIKLINRYLASTQKLQREQTTKIMTK